MARTPRTTRARRAATVAAVAAALVALGGCTGPKGLDLPATSPPAPVTTAGADTRALRDVAPDGVLVGSSVVGGGHLADTGTSDPFGTDDAYRTLLATQFSSLTPENALKWASVHPERDRYDFAAADAVVDFAEQHGQAVRGHNLLWYQSNPAWLLGGTFTDDELRAILHDHVTTVVGHFKGRISAWDVANEIFDEDGTLRPEIPFVDRLGIEAVADAFRWAHDADPAAVLYLNDFDVESSAPKRQAYLDLVGQLQAQGVPVDGFGVQGHLSLDSPFPTDLEATLEGFANLGLDVAITELDVRIPLHGSPPSDAQLALQADYYRQAVTACLAVDRCRSVTVWGAPDTYSWVPSFFPNDGAATPFADDTTLKPAFAAMAEALAAGRP